MHYGEAVVGLVGTASQCNYTAHGLVAAVSNRLQSVTEAYELIISETVLAHLDRSFEVQPCKPEKLKGLSEPVKYFLVLSHPFSNFLQFSRSENEPL
jgi:class 3 adenylate cyclase